MTVFDLALPFYIAFPVLAVFEGLFMYSLLALESTQHQGDATASTNGVILFINTTGLHPLNDILSHSTHHLQRLI